MTTPATGAPSIEFRDSTEAFESAIASGRLTDGDPSNPRYAGRFMYMGHVDGEAAFKDIETRQYLPAPVRADVPYRA